MKMMTKILGMMMLFTALPAWSATITVSVKIPKPSVWQDGSGFTHVRIPGFVNAGHAGAPELPVGFEQVLIPPGQRVLSVKALPAKSLNLGKVTRVYPKQAPWPLSWGKPPFTPADESVYSRTDSFPGQMVEQQQLQHLRGFVILPVLVHPVIYKPGSGELAYVPEMKVVIRTSMDTSNRIQKNYRGLPSDFDLVRNLVSNPDELAAYGLRTRTDRDTHRYLIITNQSLSACAGPYNLQALADDKASRGLSPLIATTQDITSQYPGADDAEKVRNFIEDKYQNDATEYVLLVGDADLEVVGGETQAPIVPVRGLCCYLDGLGTEYNIPSDLYYAALDGDFNANGNSCWGEQDDNTDLLPEVFVGRVPADNCTEVRNFVRKTLAYQNSNGDWLRNVYMVGEWLWDNGGDHEFGIDFLTDVQNSSMADGYDTLGFSESDFYQVTVMDDKFEDGPDCDNQPSPCWSAQDMLDVLNGGNHIINHLGHSYTNYNMRLYCDDISSGLTNDLPFFDYSQGCYPAAFDNRTDSSYNYQVFDQDSFVEYLLLGAHGAFAAVMNTRYGLGWSSNYFQRFFWDAAFRENIDQLGPMQAYSQEKMSSGVWTDGGIQWVYYVANLFGDPELAIHGILPMQGPYLIYFDHEITSDGTSFVPALPGQHVVMPITVKNNGADAATTITANVHSSNPLVNITQDTPVFSDIAASENGRSSSHVEFDISPEAKNGDRIEFSLDWTASGEYSGSFAFPVVVQSPHLLHIAQMVDDSIAACDTDGIADAQEASTFSVSIENQGSIDASGVVVSLSAPDCDISGPVSLGVIPAGSTSTADFTVTPSLDIDCPAINWPFTVSVQSAELPQAEVSSFTETLNADLIQSDFSDDMEGAAPNGWSHSASIGSDDWGYTNTSSHSPTHAWYTADISSKSDKYLLTPSLSIGGAAQMTFWHRMQSEANYDGGIVEISVNGGDFQDLGAYITQNGYNDTINEYTDSVLAGRAAWAGSISWQQVTVDLSSFGPAEVVIRFRFASDASVNVTGWWIDDLVIQAQTPICQQLACIQAPVADAGPDQNVESGDLVQLDGSASHDPNGGNIQLVWSQESGPAVDLSNPLVTMPTFTAPVVEGSADLVFNLQVSNGTVSSSDSVTVTVYNCDDSNRCTTDSFSGESCSHTVLADCTPCGQDGACINGSCAEPDQNGQILCDDGDACTTVDTCQAGVCTGGEPIECQAGDDCHGAVCNPQSGQCEYPVLEDGTACDDQDECTQGDTCQAGQCESGQPVVCQASDQCHEAGQCDPQTGVCSDPQKQDGTTCDDHDACTTTDTCQAGVCTGGDAIECEAPDDCHEAVCDPQSGQCEQSALQDGTACDDQDKCTQGDTCQAGQCESGQPVVCQASDECHEAGECDPQNGTCSNPQKQDGTSCDDGDGTCQAGICTPNASSGCNCSTEGDRKSSGLLILLFGLVLALPRRMKKSRS